MNLVIAPKIKHPPLLAYGVVAALVGAMAMWNRVDEVAGAQPHFGQYPRIESSLSTRYAESLAEAGITQIQCQTETACSYTTAKGATRNFSVAADADVLRVGLLVRTRGQSVAVAADWDPDHVVFDSAYRATTSAIEAALHRPA